MPSSRQQSKACEAAKILLDPVRCASVFLKSWLWLKQEEILLSVKTHRKTAVKACHASGKTYVAAVAVLWWLITHPNGIVVTTAPTWMQVERVLWGEIHAAVNRAAYAFPKPSATKLELGRTATRLASRRMRACDSKGSTATFSSSSTRLPAYCRKYTRRSEALPQVAMSEFWRWVIRSSPAAPSTTPSPRNARPGT